MTNKPRQATLEDVARRAGVSTATVSRCLNQPDQVISKTREKVAQAVEELGYRPNFSARALAARRSNTIGAIIPTMENAIFARAVQAFQLELSKQDYELLVACSLFQKEVEEEQIRALVARGAEGLLLIGRARDPEIYDFLKAQQIPYVLAWSAPKVEKNNNDDAVHAVGFDNEQAMFDMVSKVIDYGHSNLAMISGIYRDNDRAMARRQGFIKAVKSRGLHVDDHAIVQSEYDILAARQACRALLERDNVPTAIICANDVLATGAILEAKQLGFDVPNDVSITGFDDIELAQVIEPNLTTVHVPHADIGRLSAQSLFQQIQSDNTHQNAPLQTSIIERNSLAKPRKD